MLEIRKRPNIRKKSDMEVNIKNKIIFLRSFYRFKKLLAYALHTENHDGEYTDEGIGTPLQICIFDR